MGFHPIHDIMAALDTTYRPCPACDGVNGTPLSAYSPADWSLVTCDTCDFVYLRDPPAYEDLVDDLAFEKTYAAKKAASRGSTAWSPVNRAIRSATGTKARNRARRYLDWFGGGKVLDIGCGPGRQLPEPITPYGIELSRAYWAEADAKFRLRGGYCLHAAGATGIWQFDEGMFDGILMHSYLEHEVEVMTVLTGAFRALKPGGKAFVRVPNYGSLNRRVIGRKWCGFRHPDHVNYFTTDSLRRVAAKAGFDMDITNRLTLPVDDNINALLTRPRTN